MLNEDISLDDRSREYANAMKHRNEIDQCLKIMDESRQSLWGMFEHARLSEEEARLIIHTLHNAKEVESNRLEAVSLYAKECDTAIPDKRRKALRSLAKVLFRTF